MNAASLSLLTNTLRVVVRGYFPEPDSLEMDEDEGRSSDDLLADLVEAVCEVIES